MSMVSVDCELLVLAFGVEIHTHVDDMNIFESR